MSPGLVAAVHAWFCGLDAILHPGGGTRERETLRLSKSIDRHRKTREFGAHTVGNAEVFQRIGEGTCHLVWNVGGLRRGMSSSGVQVPPTD